MALLSLGEPDRVAQKNARFQLERDGYTVIRERDLGLGIAHREQIRVSHFNGDVLRRYPDDIPADRLRARDVVRYDWVATGEIRLTEHNTIAIEGRGDHPGRRDFDRVKVLDDHIVEHWISEVLYLLPDSPERKSGTFGINFFRTFTNVVTKPHQDGEEYIVIYVVDKIGAGARTQLFALDDEILLFEQELRPGELIIFRDDRFRHNATPLLPAEDGIAQRDAMVCTVNYPDTYDLGGGTE
jgi:2OG-Fe dioxygenase